MTTAVAEKVELIDRVRNGNALLFHEWERAGRCLDEDQRVEIMDRIDRAWPRLDALCQQLILEGYDMCLYAKPLCKTGSIDNWFCYVCPAGRRSNL